MRYMHIEVGSEDGGLARMSRAEGSDTIEIHISRGGRERRIQIDAGSQDRAGHAAAVHEAVEGWHGTQGDIFPYANAIELLADQ